MAEGQMISPSRRATRSGQLARIPPSCSVPTSVKRLGVKYLLNVNFLRPIHKCKVSAYPRAATLHRALYVISSQQALPQNFEGIRGEWSGKRGLTTNTSHKSGSSLEANTLWADHVLDRPAAR